MTVFPEFVTPADITSTRQMPLESHRRRRRGGVERESLAAKQSGAIASGTIVLLTADEMDKAAQKAVSFRPPGQ